MAFSGAERAGLIEATVRATQFGHVAHFPAQNAPASLKLPMFRTVVPVLVHFPAQNAPASLKPQDPGGAPSLSADFPAQNAPASLKP